MKTLRITKSERTARFYEQMTQLGFTFEEANQLRRIEKTLHRWAEMECGDGNDYASWSIERDEETQKPFKCVYPHSGKSYRIPIPDREKGALRRLAAILKERFKRIERTAPDAHSIVSAGLIPYHQTDPRGCALYLLRDSDVHEGESLDSIYNRGVSVTI